MHLIVVATSDRMDEVTDEPIDWLTPKVNVNVNVSWVMDWDTR